MPVSQRFLALFGPKSAGKTVFLASLYGFPPVLPGRSYHIAAADSSDDRTHAYLSHQCERLTRQEWPHATPWGEGLNRLTFAFTTERVRHDIVIPDISGELTARAEQDRDWDQARQDLKAKILAEYRDYHGYLIFVPPDQPDLLQAARFKWEIDALLSALKERTPDGGRLNRPIAVVVPKWDLVCPAPEDAEAEKEKAEQFVRSHYPGLAGGLDETCNNWKVFPVSSTGPIAADGLPPKELQPFNLAEPVIWLLEKADRVLLDLAVAYVDRIRGSLFTRDPEDPGRHSRYTVAEGRFQQYLAEIPTGPLAEGARSHLASLRKSAWRQRGRQAALVAVIALLCLLGAGWWRDHGAFSRAGETMGSQVYHDDEEARIATAKALVSDRSRLVGWVLGYHSRLDRQVKEYIQRAEDRDAQSILNAPEQLTSEFEAAELQANCERFLGRYRASQARSTVESKQGLAVRALEELKSRRQFGVLNGQYEAYKQEKAPGAKLVDQLVTGCKTFLENFKQTPHREQVQLWLAEINIRKLHIDEDTARAELNREIADVRADPLKGYRLCAVFLEGPHGVGRYREEVTNRQSQLLESADDQKYASITKYARDLPTKFPELISLCDQYLVEKQFKKNRTAVDGLRKTAEKSWDRYCYERIRERANDGSDAATILATHALCDAYMAATCPHRMEKDVVAWKKSFESLKQGKELSVKLTKVQVARKSRWHKNVWNPRVKGKVTVGDSAYSTGIVVCVLDREESSIPDADLGPFHWTWGMKEVKLALDWSGETLVADLAEDAFMARHLNSKVEFDGGRIIAWFSCPAVAFPPLPPYKE